MKLNKLIQKFNQPDVQLVISEWPEQNSKSGYHGVAAFTKETLFTLAKNHSLKFVVLAETNNDNQPQLACNGKILVLRVFDHKHPTLYPVILNWLAKFNRIRQVTVHSEFGACSGLRHFVLLIPFLMLIKLTGRRIVFFAHNVVDKIDYLAPHLNINQNKLLLRTVNVLIHFYYFLLTRVNNTVIVLDASAKEKLEKYTQGEKVLLIPHWVKPRKTSLSKESAKKILGINPKSKVILSFGYISWYKGSDVLARVFAQATQGNSHYQLIFAGGPAYSRSGNGSYDDFYEDFNRFVSTQLNIRLTGFVPDQKVGTYFAAADLVILPYRGLMGGSGSFAYTVGYNKPFLTSKEMAVIWKNPDLSRVLSQHNLISSDVIFQVEHEFLRAIKLLSNRKQLTKIVKLSREIKRIRGIEHVCNSLYTRVYATKTATKAPFRLVSPSTVVS